jgi:ABC-2 type transport system ATP-binding protein
VFLDEPTIGLDVIAKASIRQFIASMNREGTTFILTTHDLDDVCELAERVVIINKGEKVFDGALPELTNYLGRKKIIELTLSEPIGSDSELNIIDKPNDYQVTIEADMDSISIGEYISKLNSSLKITDISVKELPMERIIADIYAK